MAGSQTGSPGATRTVRIVYEVEGVEGAVTDQEALEGALQRTGEALGEQSERVERVESALGSLSDMATHSEQVQQRLHQSLQALAGGLQQVSSILGQESEGGRVIGQMSQFAATGIQLGSAFGPLGGVLGGVTGAVLGLGEALTPVPPAIREVTDEARQSADAALQMADAFDGAGDRMRAFLDDISTASRSRDLQDLNARIAEMSDRVATLRGGDAMQRLEAMSMTDELSRLMAQSAEMQAGLDQEGRETSGGRGRRGGGGGRRRDVLGELMQRASGGSDAVGFAAGLDAADVSGRPSDFEVEGADLRRQGRNRRFGGQTQAEIRAVQLLADKQREAHEAQMERISQQVEAWNEAGQKIGGAVYNAFTTAVSGQESFEVAMVKGFKSLAVQFGGQMVNEGIAALLTAAGNAVANPPVAATKAAEGAGKLALGVGLGAAGAAIPVPSAGGGQQSKPPRLGPAQPDSGGGSSVIVNMNAPSVVTSTEAQLGRSLGRSLNEARMRYGRAA